MLWQKLDRFGRSWTYDDVFDLHSRVTWLSHRGTAVRSLNLYGVRAPHLGRFVCCLSNIESLSCSFTVQVCHAAILFVLLLVGGARLPEHKIAPLSCYLCNSLWQLLYHLLTVCCVEFASANCCLVYVLGMWHASLATLRRCCCAAVFCVPDASNMQYGLCVHLSGKGWGKDIICNHSRCLH